MNRRIVGLFVLAGLFAPCSFLRGASLTLTPTKDTSIFQTVPNNNVGGAQSLASGGTATRGPVRMLMRFDPSTISGGSIITNVTLDVTVVLLPDPNPQASTFALHRLLADWGEGTGGTGVFGDTGRAATSGEASWNNRFHPATPWNVAGARAGVDYVAAPSGTAAVHQGSSRFVSTPEMVDDVQKWLENPSANFGWIVISQSETNARTARRFGSKEHPVLASRPTLTIQHTSFAIEKVALVGNEIGFEFPGQKGGLYQVQVNAGFAPLQWAPWTNIGPLPTLGRPRISAPTDQATGFYRIKRLPAIVTEPQSQSVNPGTNAQFSVVAFPDANLTYQWRLNGNPIAHATNATLTVLNVDGEDVGDYTVVVTSGLDTIISAPAQLTLRIAPVIVQQPQSQTAVVGSTVSFTVVVTNTATLPIWYRWRKSGANLSLQMLNERTSTFTITNVQPSAAGSYNVIITNSVFFTPGFQSTPAVLTVTNP